MDAIAGRWGEIAGILAALSAALSSLQVRGFGGSAHPMVINALRCGLATIGFVLLWWFGSRQYGDWQQAAPLLIICVLFGLVVGDSLYFASITRIGPGRSTPIAMSYPLPTAVLASVVLGERLSGLQFAGIVLGVAAIWVIAAKRQERDGVLELDRDYWFGIVFAIAASLCWSVSVLVLRPALAMMPLDFANLLRMGLAALLLPVFGYPVMRKATFGTRRARFAILTTGMGVTAVTTSYFLTASIHHSGAAVASILSSMAPVFAAPMAWLFFQEAVTLRTALAIALGIAGIILVVAN